MAYGGLIVAEFTGRGGTGTEFIVGGIGAEIGFIGGGGIAAEPVGAGGAGAGTVIVGTGGGIIGPPDGTGGTLLFSLILGSYIST